MYTSRLKSPQTDLLAKALLSLSDEEECYRFMEDLLTVREIRDLSQRLEVAMLLKDKVTYNEIVEKTGVSTATIGRVNRSLTYGAGGYEVVIKRIAKEDRDD
ncbi:MAG: YerC/YecD family TrpR-related protein [Christensenellales bacterium]|jgi:TrpR-related protein YerC/YecD